MNGEIELGLLIKASINESKVSHSSQLTAHSSQLTDEAVLFGFNRCFYTVNYFEGEVCKCLSKYMRLEQSTALPVQ
jgi:hypothetical protein